jgi:ankyrin repeat protein
MGNRLVGGNHPGLRPSTTRGLSWRRGESKRTRTTTEVVELLLAAGADVEAIDEDGPTPLALARRHDAEELVQLLSHASAPDRRGEGPARSEGTERTAAGAAPDAP